MFAVAPVCRPKLILRTHTGGGPRGKFVSGNKVLAAVPSISQPRRVYRELYENEDGLETGGEAVVNKD